MAEETLTWFAGVDWGSERHQACLLDAQGNIVAEREFPHSGAGLAELGDWLLSVAGAADTVAVAIEVPHGPVVESLAASHSSAQTSSWLCKPPSTKPPPCRQSRTAPLCGPAHR